MSSTAAWKLQGPWFHPELWLLPILSWSVFFPSLHWCLQLALQFPPTLSSKWIAEVKLTPPPKCELMRMMPWHPILRVFSAHAPVFPRSTATLTWIKWFKWITFVILKWVTMKFLFYILGVKSCCKEETYSANYKNTLCPKVIVNPICGSSPNTK